MWRPKESTYRINGSIEGIQIDDQVDSGIRKSRHAARVVSIRINMVNTNGVCAQLFHEAGIERALLSIDEWISFSQLVCDTWSICK